MAYIGVQPADAYTSFAVQHFTTSATTSYTLDHSVANENEIALFINNVRQEPGSSYAYTASGTTLTLSAATSASDTMYCVFIGKAVQTVTPANGSVTNDMISYPLAESGATVSTFNRTSSDGNILELQKDGTAVGSIGNYSTAIYFGQGDTTVMIDEANDQFTPRGTNGATRTDTINLGSAGSRWNNLYLGGNIYLGGTGSANALDDYEEGTFTPVFTSSGGNYTITYSGQQGRYTKIGNTVVCHFLCAASGTPSGGSGTFRLGGLPFLPVTGAVIPAGHGSVGISNNLNINVDAVQLLWNLGTEATYADFMFLTDSSSVTSTANSPYTVIHNSNPRIDGTLIYRTNA